MRTDGFAERLLDLVGERLRGLERGDVVLGNDDRCILRNVTRRLLRALLQNETAETSQIDIFLPCKRLFDRLHECFHRARTVALSMPVFFAISLTISALVILI